MTTTGAAGAADSPIEQPSTGRLALLGPRSHALLAVLVLAEPHLDQRVGSFAGCTSPGPGSGRARRDDKMAFDLEGAALAL